MQLTSDQIRAARALLRLDQAEIARRAHVSIITIRRLEGAESGTSAVSPTLDAVRAVLEQAGAEFIPDGVRRRRVAPADMSARFDALRAISLASSARLRAVDQLTDSDLYDEDGLPG